MRISVIVPTFNRRETVQRTMHTLFAQTFPAEAYEVIVVVDGSTDGTAEMIRGLSPPCRLRVIEQENRGLAAARNTGLRHAKGELVLFLDDDMLCSPGLIEAHVHAHEGAQGSVVFGAIFLSADSPRSLAAECFNREIGAFYLQPRQSAEIAWQEVECVFSNSSLSPASLIDAGGFDEQFKMREDMELGVRLCKAGIRAYYTSTAVSYQYYDKTSTDLIRDAEAFAVSDALFARKHKGGRFLGHGKYTHGRPFGSNEYLERPHQI